MIRNRKLEACNYNISVVAVSYRPMAAIQYNRGEMTYNFDPEAWLERQITALDTRREGGEIDGAAHSAELADLHHRYDDMVTRLDGTYEIPSTDPSRPPSG